MNWKLIWRGLKNADMRNKLLAVFGILIVYRMLSHIPIPLAEPTELKQLIDNLLNNEGIPQLLSFINVLSGGALASLSIMLVGLGPYINASIAMQVLTRALPKLEKLQKEGEYGRKKINQYTRLLTLPLAIIQSVLAIFIVRQLASQVSGLGDIAAGAGWSDWLLMIATLTAGAMILMWLGELITEKSIGNGISLLITVAIVSQLPFMITSLYNSVITDGFNSGFGESAIINVDSGAPIIAATPGSTANTFKAVDKNDEVTEWQYVFIDEATSCGESTDFVGASDYVEGEDVSYSAENNGQKACFRSTLETATAYGVSPLIVTDEDTLKVTVGFGNGVNTFSANDNSGDTTQWRYVFIDGEVACDESIDFEIGEDDIPGKNRYNERANISYSAENNGQKACFRSTSGVDFSVFGWFRLPVNSQALWYSLILLGSMGLVTVFVVYLNEAQRKIKLSYAKKIQGNRIYSDVSTFLPIKLISAGVVPIIFALAFLSVPQMVGNMLSGVESPFWSELGGNLLVWFSAPGTSGAPVFQDFVGYIYPIGYFMLVVIFTYFYTSIVFSAKDISERLQRQGGFIEGVRPGEETQKHLASIVSRLNFFGSISLGFLALTPILAQAFLGTNQLALGGTSILILVAVALETLRQIESKALMVTYDDYEQNFKNRDAPKKKKKRFPFKKRL